MERQGLSADKSFEVAATVSSCSFYATAFGCLLSSPSPSAKAAAAFSLPIKLVFTPVEFERRC